MKFLATLVAVLILIAIGIGVWIWSGTYNIGADVPHWSFTRHVIGALRENSIDARADDVKLPDKLDLNDPALIAEGAHHYAHMCVGCHLAPGMQKSELREGLYPRPPNLTRFSPRPTEAFWIIKHGIKMTAMPAWGKSHTDQQIWAMVAYLQKQPHMSAARFRQLAGLPPPGSMTMHRAPTPAAPASVPTPASAHSTP